MIRVTHKGYTIVVHGQYGGGKYLDYCAYATKTDGRRVRGFNVEGHTAELALAIAKRQINTKESQ